MVYIEDFDSFAQRVEALLRRDPSKFRYTIKYRNSDSKLVMKATDDELCIKYKTDRSADIQNLGRLTGALVRAMTTDAASHKRTRVDS
eukprot:ANDGO_08569.mRNA.1 Signal recognition particle 9 kDa protein